MEKSDFQFSTPYLTYLNFKINKNFDEKENIKIDNAFNISINRIKDENHAYVMLNVVINKDNEKAPFQIESSIAADFSWEKLLSQNEISGLLHQNAPALLLSYLRPIIANITNSSPFPEYDLPFVNFFED